MSNCKKMAVAQGALLGAGLQAFQQQKIDKALAGEKTFTKPKTLFGKLIGGVSGRTAAAEIQELSKTDPLNPKVLNAMAPSQTRQSTPITGGFSFGQEAKTRPYLPYIIVAGIVGIFYLMRRKGGRRRR
jgi:hypothetical protein